MQHYDESWHTRLYQKLQIVLRSHHYRLLRPIGLHKRLRELNLSLCLIPFHLENGEFSVALFDQIYFLLTVVRQK